MATPPTGNPEGRPTKYNPEFLQSIQDLSAEGLSVLAIAGALNVTEKTLYNWAERYPDFADALELARPKRALFHERKLCRSKTAPDVTASLKTLAGIDRKMWGDKHEVDLNGQIYITVNAVSAAELAGGNG